MDAGDDEPSPTESGKLHARDAGIRRSLAAREHAREAEKAMSDNSRCNRACCGMMGVFKYSNWPEKCLNCAVGLIHLEHVVVMDADGIRTGFDFHCDSVFQAARDAVNPA